MINNISIRTVKRKGQSVISLIMLVFALTVNTVSASENSGINIPEIPDNIRFHTRSIVACDPIEDACGIAVVSFTSGVPAVVPVGEAGVMVANQGYFPSYGTSRNIIENIKTYHMNADDALTSALANDPLSELHQMGVAALDPSQPSGVSVANFTGAINTLELPQTCNVVGGTYAVQGALQTSDSVCSAMATAFENEQGSLAMRLLNALLAGTAAGQDARGETSASVKVYSGSWALSDVTPLSADANVDRSKNWEEELNFSVSTYLATLAPPDQRNLLKIRENAINKLLEALSNLGYYQGAINGVWSSDAENALAAFGAANQFFPRATVLDNGERFIDGPTASYIIDGEKRQVVVPAAP